MAETSAAAGDGWSARLDRKDENSFDILRLLLAGLVLFEHSFFLTANSYDGEPLFRLTGGQFNSGSLAVCLFFAISGFLVTRSHVLTAGLGRYLLKRIARIFPGFLVATAIGCLLGWLVADHPQVYFSQQRWPLLALEAVTLHQIVLSGILGANPVHLIHGTLWTIQYEFDCYVLVALLGWLGLLTPRRAWLPYLAIFAGLGLAQAGVFRLPMIDHGVAALLLSNPVQWPFLFLFFFVASAFYLYRAHMPKSPLLFLGALLLLGVSARAGGMYWALLTCGTYIVLYAALSTRANLEIFGRRVDLSYGTYLYGWPVAQLLLYFTHQSLGPWTLFFLSLPLTLAAAYASWRLVEYPALHRLKGRNA